MDIGFIGCGLIGGSLIKSLDRNAAHNIHFYDTDDETVKKVKLTTRAKYMSSLKMMKNCDVVFVCLHPKKSIDFIKNNIENFKKGAVVSDVCGVKQSIADAVEDLLCENGINYIGTHPMAGREFSGFDYATDTLFENAYFIIAKPKNNADISPLTQIAKDCRFKEIVITTAKKHDEIIAFTSQLAHIVSSAYIKSPTALLQCGFSAGSFLDMTRVAYLNENMWTELFLMNGQSLCSEIETIIGHLEEYKKAIETKNADTLKALLKKGRELKEKTNAEK